MTNIPDCQCWEFDSTAGNYKYIENDTWYAWNSDSLICRFCDKPSKDLMACGEKATEATDGK